MGFFLYVEISLFRNFREYFTVNFCLYFTVTCWAGEIMVGHGSTCTRHAPMAHGPVACSGVDSHGRNSCVRSMSTTPYILLPVSNVVRYNRKSNNARTVSWSVVVGNQSLQPGRAGDPSTVLLATDNDV